MRKNFNEVFSHNFASLTKLKASYLDSSKSACLLSAVILSLFIKTQTAILKEIQCLV